MLERRLVGLGVKDGHINAGYVEPGLAEFAGQVFLHFFYQVISFAHAIFIVQLLGEFRAEGDIDFACERGRGGQQG